MIVEQEETLWLQRSPLQWLNSGERNTKFLYVSVAWRRGKQRISQLKDDQRTWISDPKILKEMVLKSLYIAEPCSPCDPTQYDFSSFLIEILGF